MIDSEHQKQFRGTVRTLEQVLLKMLSSVWPEVFLEFRNMEVGTWMEMYNPPKILAQIRRGGKIVSVCQAVNTLVHLEVKEIESYITYLGNGMIQSLSEALVELGSSAESSDFYEEAFRRVAKAVHQGEFSTCPDQAAKIVAKIVAVALDRDFQEVFRRIEEIRRVEELLNG